MDQKKKLYDALKGKDEVQIRSLTTKMGLSTAMIRDIAITHQKIKVSNYYFIRGKVIFVKRVGDLLIKRKL